MESACLIVRRVIVGYANLFTPCMESTGKNDDTAFRWRESCFVGCEAQVVPICEPLILV